MGVPTKRDTSFAAAAAVTSSRVLKNVVANYTYFVLQAFVLLFLQGYVIRSVGLDEYAVWPLCRICISVSALIQIGIGAGAGRFLSHAIGSQDVEQFRRVISTFFLALSIAATGYFFAFVYVGWNFSDFFNITDGVRVTALRVMCLLGLAGAVLMPFSVFEAVLNASQERVRLNVIRTILLLTRLLVVILGFELMTPSLVWIATTQLLLSVAECACLWMVSRRVFPWLRISLPCCDWATFRTVNSFSILTLVTSIAGKLYWDADKIIINRLLDPELVVGYSVVVVLLTQSLQISRLATSAFSSPLTILYAKGEKHRIANILYRANRLSVPVSGVVVGFLTCFGGDVLQIYIGSEFSSFGKVFYILGPAVMLSLTQTLNARVPSVCGEVKLPAVASVIAAVCNVLLSLFFVTQLEMGLSGIALGTFVLIIPYRLTFNTIYAAKLLEIPRLEYFVKLVLQPLIYSAPGLLVLVLARITAGPLEIIGLLCTGCASMIVQLYFTIQFGIFAQDRDSVIMWCRRAHIIASEYWGKRRLRSS